MHCYCYSTPLQECRPEHTRRAHTHMQGTHLTHTCRAHTAFNTHMHGNDHLIVPSPTPACSSTHDHLTNPPKQRRQASGRIRLSQSRVNAICITMIRGGWDIYDCPYVSTHVCTRLMAHTTTCLHRPMHRWPSSATAPAGRHGILSCMPFEPGCLQRRY